MKFHVNDPALNWYAEEGSASQISVMLLLFVIVSAMGLYTAMELFLYTAELTGSNY